MRPRPLWSITILAAVLVLAAGLPSPAHGRSAMITFKVQTPEYTPEDARIYISGNLTSLGPWDPGKVELGSVGDQLYAITLVLPVGTELKFKFTRGSWGTVEKGTDFEEIADREYEVVGDEAIPITVENWRDFSPVPETHSVTGDVDLLLDFAATKLGNTRAIVILLPPGYRDDEERRYPVLYMHDGQNLFDAGSAFVGVEWNVDETTTRMIEEGQIAPLIVVGIYNTGDRVYEYTPTVDPVRGGGGARLYADFIINDLKPYVDAEYRTLTDAEHTGVMGSSLGGIASLYLGWTRPDVFTRIGAMSPSYWWADSQIVRMIEELPPPDGLRIWMDMGTAEDRTDTNNDDISDVIETHRAVRDTLIGYGFKLGRNLKYVEDEDAPHNERAWSARFPRALKFLFPAGRS